MSLTVERLRATWLSDVMAGGEAIVVVVPREGITRRDLEKVLPHLPLPSDEHAVRRLLRG